MANKVIILPLLLAATSLFPDSLADNDATIVKLATPVLENILLGIEKNDYKIYSRDFDEGMKESLPPEKFKITQEQINNQIGKIKTKVYLGFLNKGQYTQILWKGKADKIKEDILIQLVCSKRRDAIFVTGLWFK